MKIKKKIAIITLMTLLMYGQSAYAIFDFGALAKSLLDYKTEIEHQVQEIQKKIKDMETKVRQGFNAGNSCFSDPFNCNPTGLTDAFDYFKEDGKAYEEWGFTKGKQDDPLIHAPEELLEDLQKVYTYKRGQGKDLENLNKHKKELNEKISNGLALMFAKGATTHNKLQKESDKNIYYTEFKDEKIEEIMQAEDNIALLTATRIARLLELRSNMIGMVSTAGMTLQDQENLEE